MSSQDLNARLDAFVKYAEGLWDEKGHSQVFIDRLFQTLGWPGYKEAGAVLEDRIRRAKGGTSFADLGWQDRKVLLEMKKRGEKLEKHYPQLRGYWLDTTGWRARYLMLCNFDDLWIFDMEQSTNDPVERMKIGELPSKVGALGFLMPTPYKPIFNNNVEKVSAEIANKVAAMSRALVSRGESPVRVQRFMLQCVLCMFSEDIGLLPEQHFSRALADCADGAHSTYDMLGSLFRCMATPVRARAGRFQTVPYFNGGLFLDGEAIELTPLEVKELIQIARHDWSAVDPTIFGTIFQHSMDAGERHAKGAHYTAEADIQKVILPSLVRPWRERIAATDTLAGLLLLRTELVNLRVLDPTCGSGNFLYVAYREMRRLELAILQKIRARFPTNKAAELGFAVSVRQLFGFDVLPFAVEIAKMTLMLAKELSIREVKAALDDAQLESTLLVDPALPLDNLDANIKCEDSLFNVWPPAHLIIGNPPFVDARNLTVEHGSGYSAKVRTAFPDVPGRADYCVYFFRRVHDHLTEGGMAGLVGTNSIRQTYSRIGGLDYIVATGGTIFDAVGTQDWSGDAAVHVSIVNWTKGVAHPPFQLAIQHVDVEGQPWSHHSLDRIPSSLSEGVDVSHAVDLSVNRQKFVYEGQQTGHIGFVLHREQAQQLLRLNGGEGPVYPYLSGDDLVSGNYAKNPRYVIDFGDCDSYAAQQHAPFYQHIRSVVQPTWTENAKREKLDSGLSVGEHQNRLRTWWRLKRRRADLLKSLRRLTRYIAVSSVTKRSIFAFVRSDIRPSNAIKAITLEDDYSFGVISSVYFWEWVIARGSTLKGDPRFTPETTVASFPWPQSPTLAQVRAVAEKGRSIRALRDDLALRYGWSLREMYARSEHGGDSPLRLAHQALDKAVSAAYNARPTADPLEFLLALNQSCAEREAKGEAIVGPGLPPVVTEPAPFITADCVTMPPLV
jgi:SAM-dependent methyltransferase